MYHGVGSSDKIRVLLVSYKANYKNCPWGLIIYKRKSYYVWKVQKPHSRIRILDYLKYAKHVQFAKEPIKLKFTNSMGFLWPEKHQL